MEVISYLGSLLQFSPAKGRAGCCRQRSSLCVGSTFRDPATLGLPHTGVSVLSPSTLLRLLAALYGAGPALSAVPVFRSSTTAWILLHLRVVSSPASVVQAAKGLRVFSLHGERLRQPEVWAASPQVRRAFSLRRERPGQPEVWAASPQVRRAFSLRSEWPRQPEAWVPSPRPWHAFFLRGPSACHRSGFRKSLDRNPGRFAGWEGVPSLGLSLPLSPPPASYLQRGWGGSSLEFLSPFVLRNAGGVFGPVNSSLALPQFKKSPSGCSQGLLASPHPKQCLPLLSISPPLGGGGCGHLGYFSAGSCF